MPITWMVLARDVSETVSVRGADRLAAVLILDVDTSLVRGAAIETSRGKALKKAVGLALTQPAGDLPPGPPQRVLCERGQKSTVRTALFAAGGAGRPVIEEVLPSDDAEDVFDSMLGHLSGRTQAKEPPSPADWRLLMGYAVQFRRTKPWTRWSDEQDLIVELDGAGGPSTHLVIVMGNAGVQRGLAVYPGEERPAYLRDAAAEPQPPPPGSLLLFLDPVGDIPQDVVRAAIRRGWPATDTLAPFAMTSTPDGAAELGRDDARRLSAVLAAVRAVEERGPALADAAGTPVAGSVVLADDEPVQFRIDHRPPAPAGHEPSLRLHVAGHDLLPPDTRVTIGHVTWPSLAELRGTAQVYRPAPTDAPPPAGREVPLVVLSPAPNDGPALAARIADLDPFGVSVVEAGSEGCVVVLAGGSGAEVLAELPAGHAAVVTFERRLRQASGRQAIMIADASSATGAGAVYGLFECHQPLDAPTKAKRQSPSRARPATGTTRLRVTLRHVEPRVQRTVDVPAAITLADLHDVLQAALGWTNSHLHRFETETASYARPDDDWDDDWDDGVLDDRTTRLTSLPPRFTYLYDFGDNWEHDVELLGAGGDEPGCVSGEGACPPEDCGGTSGYAELLEALGNPRHREHREMTAWVGDRLRPFDRPATDALVRAVVGQVPDSVRMLLRLIGGGVKLTQAGRLPRALVRGVQEQRPDWFDGARPASGEDDSPVLSALHELLRRVGVLRLRKGVLQPVKAAADDRELLRRVRSGYEDGSFDRVLAEAAVAHVVARGPMTAAELAAAVRPWIGDGWRRGGEPITDADVRRLLAYLSADLAALDLITMVRGQWSAGPSALTVLPGVAPSRVSSAPSR